MSQFTREELLAMLAAKDEEEEEKKQKELTELAEEMIELIENNLDDSDFPLEDVLRGMAEISGIAVKKPKKRSSKKGKPTGITRDSGKRAGNAFIILLQEERRKYKIKETKEPTVKNVGWNLKDVVGQIWAHFKSMINPVTNKNYVSKDAIFQEGKFHNLWNIKEPLKNCTPFFKTWWLECEDKEAYQTNTDWKKYYKIPTVGGATKDENATDESTNKKIIESIPTIMDYINGDDDEKKKLKKKRKKDRAKAKAKAKAKAEAEAKAKAKAEAEAKAKAKAEAKANEKSIFDTDSDDSDSDDSDSDE